MDSLRGEDSVTFGDDSAEENYQSASEDTPGVGFAIDSRKNTLKSAVGALPQVCQGIESEPGQDKKVSESDPISQGEIQGESETKKDQTVAEEIQGGGKCEENSQSMGGREGGSELGVQEEWSVVDPVSETQGVGAKDDRECAKDNSKEAGPKSYASVAAEESKAREPGVEETSSVTTAEPPEIKFAGDKPISEISTTVSAKMPEIQELQNAQMGYPTVSSTLSNASESGVPFTYIEKPTSLRRRTLSSKNSEGGSTPIDSGIASFGTPRSLSHTSPSLQENESELGFKDRPDVVSDLWNKRSSSRITTKQPRFPEEGKRKEDHMKGNGQLQDVQSEITAHGSPLEQSRTADMDPSDRTRRPKFPSGYDFEGDDDDADSAISELERRSSDISRKKKVRIASGNLDVKGLATEQSPRRDVYTIPDNDVEQLEQGRNGTQIFTWPAELLVTAVGYQVKLIVRVIAISIWMFHFAWSLISRPFQRTMEVKDRATDIATDAVNRGFGLISQAKESTGPLVSKLSKKTLFGCLGSAYVIFVLSVLLIPAFFLDLMLLSRMVEEPVQLRQILDFDYTQARPNATVPVLTSLELEKAKRLPLEKLGAFRKIPAGHNFHINVILTMPESEYNIRLGMFQVTAEMLSARNQVLMRQSKPCMLRFRSTPIRLFKTIVYSIPYLMGFWTETQKLEIIVLQAQEKLVPTASVRILLEPKAGYPQGGGLPELYEAELHLESALPWPKAIVRRWKWTFYVWNGVCLFLFEVAMILCCCRQVLLPRFGGGELNNDNILLGEVKQPSKADIGVKRSKNKHVSFEDDIVEVAGAESANSSTLPVSMSSVEGGSSSTSSSDAERDVGWSMPPLEETIHSVEEGMKAMEETVMNLGETLVGGVAEGLGQAFTNVTMALDEIS